MKILRQKEFGKYSWVNPEQIMKDPDWKHIQERYPDWNIKKRLTKYRLSSIADSKIDSMNKNSGKILKKLMKK